MADSTFLNPDSIAVPSATAFDSQLQPGNTSMSLEPIGDSVDSVYPLHTK